MDIGSLGVFFGFWRFICCYHASDNVLDISISGGLNCLSKTFALHKVEAFDIMLKNWVKNPFSKKKRKKKNLRKSLLSFFKGSSNKKRM
jgi:hypothetical protein